ncbi:hypothetical protein CHS0354_039248 [Potamilus streckersoni]|uniref:Tetraspanin n=1 Tax=Potamilus streckersoni TaxID=2493646 RepID=A0AAE0VEX8_9BIVA|nr:hypothetical protein CHS0354_039248 [Potamilus streckersoni]
MVPTCTKEKCSRTGFIVMTISFSILGAALLIASCVVRFDHNMTDKHLGYFNFQKALQSANVKVHTPSSLNIGETLDVVCIVFIVGGVLFLVLGIMGIIGTIFKLKALLITYAVVLLAVVVLELICVILVATITGKIEGWITDSLKESIRNQYTGITGNDIDTLRWNFIMHSLQCCGVNRYTDFRDLPAKKWIMDIEANSIVTGKRIPFACCKVKNDTTCVLNPNIKTSFIEKGCYQVIRNWVTSYSGVLVGVGVIILVIELILVVLGFVIFCTLRKKTYEGDQNRGQIQHFKLPHAHLLQRNQNMFYPGNALANPDYEEPVVHDNLENIHLPRHFREILYDEPINAYDKLSHFQD